MSSGPADGLARATGEVESSVTSRTRRTNPAITGIARLYGFHSISCPFSVKATSLRMMPFRSATWWGFRPLIKHSLVKQTEERFRKAYEKRVSAASRPGPGVVDYERYSQSGEQIT